VLKYNDTSKKERHTHVKKNCIFDCCEVEREREPANRKGNMVYAGYAPGHSVQELTEVFICTSRRAFLFVFFFLFGFCTKRRKRAFASPIDKRRDARSRGTSRTPRLSLSLRETFSKTSRGLFNNKKTFTSNRENEQHESKNNRNRKRCV
jgi:hypothetical protein